MKVSAENLRAHLRAVCKLRDPFENPQNLTAVQEYIRQTFQSLGYEVRGDRFAYEGASFENLIALLPGQKEIPELIIGAHFDAVPGTLGADDNASGVAVLLETARFFAAAPSKTNVHFIAFNLEEYGLIGSQAYLRKRRQKLKDAKNENRFYGMLSLEMVGYTSKEIGSQKMPEALKPFYPETGDFLALVGDQNSQKILHQAKQAFQSPELHVELLNVPMRGNLFPEVRLSDHSPFWDEDLPALLVTDTSFFRNPHYHLPADTLETLDLDFMARTAEGAARLAQSL